MPSPEEVRGHLADIERDGFTVVEDAIEPELIDRLREDIERLERDLKIEPAVNPFEGPRTKRIYNLLAHGEIYERVPVHQGVLPLVEGVLDPGCLISSINSIAILPGERAQPIHTDDQLIPLPKPHVPVVCNAIWALTDFNDENGATRVVRGSHRFDRSPEMVADFPAYRRLVKRTYEAQPLLMRQGSVLVFNGSLWHAAGGNKTQVRRVAIAMNYCAGYIRQQENQLLGIPRGRVAHFPRRLQELIGFGIYNGLIGHIDKRNPIDLLGGSPDARFVWDT